jgi:hypothetical protein
MAKKSGRKLSLKKETLRQLDDRELGAVAGGTYSELVMLRQPSQTMSTSCTSFDCGVYLNFNIYYY